MWRWWIGFRCRRRYYVDYVIPIATRLFIPAKKWGCEKVLVGLWIETGLLPWRLMARKVQKRVAFLRDHHLGTKKTTWSPNNNFWLELFHAKLWIWLSDNVVVRYLYTWKCLAKYSAFFTIKLKTISIFYIISLWFWLFITIYFCVCI